MNATTPIATIIIPNYDGRALLPQLMASLAAQSERRFAITVVDDASSDDSVAYLRDRWPRVRLMCHETNCGFATACNTGLRAAETPFVILLNNDTHVARDWLAEGLRAFDAPDVGAVASLVLLAEPPHLIDTAGDVYSVAGGGLKRYHLQRRDRASQIGSEPFSACGASAFYRRAALAGVGWLDARLESYYEDVDVGFRLAWAGWRCVFAPRSVCYHHLSSSYEPGGWPYHFNSARNAEIVWWANMTPRLRRKYLPAHLGFLFAQCLHKLCQGHLLPYLAGKWAVLRHVAHIREKRRHIRRITRAGEAHVESLLVRDWWKLHVTSRPKRRRGPEPAESSEPRPHQTIGPQGAGP